VSTQARILSIEDHPEMRGLLQLIFERRGHRVITVKSGEFGLEMLRSLQPDVLLLDLMLPDIDGWEIYEQMKADEELSQVPVIIVSARDRAHDEKKGRRVVGNDKYVEKPFEVKELIEIVSNVLEERRVNSSTL
jgi:DNA-binding response OmpR family regulator